MKFWQSIVVLLFAFSNIGCATLINSDGLDIKISSTPEGASVSVNNTPLECVTPCFTKLEKNNDFAQVVVTKEGYSPEGRTISFSVHWSIYLNLLLYPYGLIGAAYDFLTGAHHSVNPQTIDVKLTQLGEANNTLKVDNAPPPPQPKVESPYASLPNNYRMNRIRETFPRDMIVRTLLEYYGSKLTSKEDEITARIYRVLYDAEGEIENLSLDQAISFDAQTN